MKIINLITFINFNGIFCFKNNYTNVLICICIGFLLSIFIIFLYKLITSNIKYIDTMDKVAGFECGFAPYNESRSKFYIKFYLVAVIFLIFDLEIILLYPLVPIIMNLSYINITIIYIFYIFIFFLWLGIYYELKKNILDWF